MRYLVTGGAGFIGSHLTTRLLRQGGHVVALDDLSTGSPANLRAWTGHPRLDLVRGSTADRRLVEQLAGRVDAVFHLASVVGVLRVLEAPELALRENVLGAEAVLDAAARHGHPTVFVSSSEVYGPLGRSPLSEDAAVLADSAGPGRWAYAHSKLVGEAHALTLHRDRGLPVAVARLFNTVGPGQSGRYGMVLPRFVEQAIAGRDVTVYGDGAQSRCFCDVDDVVSALTVLARRPAAAGVVVNVGSEQPTTIVRLAQRVVEATSSSSGLRFVPYEQAYGAGFEDVRCRIPDTRRIRRLLGWRPRRDLDATVRRVVDAYAVRAEGASARGR